MLWTAICLNLDELEELLLMDDLPVALMGRVEAAAESLREYRRSMETQSRQRWNAEMNELMEGS